MLSTRCVLRRPPPPWASAIAENILSQIPRADSLPCGGAGRRHSRRLGLCEIMPPIPISGTLLKKYLLCGLSVALLAAASSLTPELQAATRTVTTTHDNGPGSLRDAIAGATRGDEIVFDPSLAGQPIFLTTGEFIIDNDLTISGLGQQQSILDGNGASRIFRITEGVSVALSDLMVRNGWPKECLADHRTRSEGGGIYNAGLLELDRCMVTQNLVDHRHSHCDDYYDSPESIRGGGVYNRSEEHTSELQSLAYLVCRLLLEKKKKNDI